MTKKTDTPAIRFKGFSDTWEQRKFEEIAVRSSVICSDANLPRVEYEDIVSGAGRLNKDIYAKQSSKSGIAFHQGDVLYGKLRPYLQNWLLPTFDGLAVGDFWVLQPQNADSSFLYRLIQSRQFDEVANQSTGTKMPRADWKLVSKTVFSIPSYISEQAAIGTYFTALDNLITLHQRKYEKLHNIKKSMLEKMFPKNGSNVPEIRFKGFTEAWEQRKVTELGKIYIGLVTTMTAHYTDEGILLIRNSDIKDGRFEFGEKPIFLEKSFAMANESRMHQIGDVITVHTGDVGTSAVISENEDKSIGFATIVTRANKTIIDPSYLCTFLNTERHKKWAVAISTGDGRTNYNLGDYFELVVPVPSIKEQKQIAMFIENLNNLITLHQRELEKLQNIKKSMLEKMFV